jgi:[NiFe] hydrogenase diaphorase moiety small subunit
VPFAPGQSILAAAQAAGHYIPHLCYHPEFKPHGSCKVCTVKVNGRTHASCTTPAHAGRRGRVRDRRAARAAEEPRAVPLHRGQPLLPVVREERQLHAAGVAYELGMTTAHYSPLFPDRPVDASHPDVLLDFNRCILCELCVRASARSVDGKHVFALSGRGITKHLIVNAESGRLADTARSPSPTRR